ncbi:MAG: aminotransferase class I/II-fold pyridoxal phosphate-dependent enzyme [Cyclobacteriaceae bacterium]
MKFETRALKSTQNIKSEVHAVSPPIYLSSTFERNNKGQYQEGYKYSRNDNPNRRALEKSIATLENGMAGFAFGSGMAAISAVFQSLKTGDHVILPDDVYFNLNLLMKEVFSRWGLSYSFVDMSDIEAVSNVLTQHTRLIWIESPSNPLLKISDIQGLSKLAHAHQILIAVDNTWPTPVLQNPLDLGADIVVHSTTKYLGGHSDVLGGCIILKESGALAHRIQSIQVQMGAIPSPFDCWLISRGIQTLHLRVTKQTENAQKLADWLAQHPKVQQVLYPGLKDHPNHEIAAQQMLGGFGAMLSLLINGDEVQTLSIANKLRLFTQATSLGGVESLVEHRKSVEGAESQTPENLLRLSLGIEHIEDLIDDWKQALI